MYIGYVYTFITIRLRLVVYSFVVIVCDSEVVYVSASHLSIYKFFGGSVETLIIYIVMVLVYSSPLWFCTLCFAMQRFRWWIVFGDLGVLSRRV